MARFLYKKHKATYSDDRAVKKIELNKKYSPVSKNGRRELISPLRCKLITRVFAVINRGTPFVNAQKFAA